MKINLSEKYCTQLSRALFDLTGKISVKKIGQKIYLSAERKNISDEKVSLGILETKFSQKCYPPNL